MDKAKTVVNIKSLREELGLTQIEFAKTLGISSGTIATIERRGTTSAAMSRVISLIEQATIEERKNLTLAKEAVTKALEKFRL